LFKQEKNLFLPKVNTTLVMIDWIRKHIIFHNESDSLKLTNPIQAVFFPFFFFIISTQFASKNKIKFQPNKYKNSVLFLAYRGKRENKFKFKIKTPHSSSLSLESPLCLGFFL
jgi:hypothetical protein